MRQPARHGRRQRRLITTARHHQRHRTPADRPRQERQAIQRRGIGPMHILDHQPHPRPGLPGHRLQQLRHRGKLPLPPPPLAAVPRTRAITRPQPRQQPLHLPPHIPRGRRQRRLQQPPALQRAQLAQCLRHRQQRQRARQRQALPPHHHPSRRRRPGHPLGSKPGLAYPRIPHHQHQPGIPAQRPHQARQLTLTPNKRHRPSHTPSPPALCAQVNPRQPSRQSAKGPCARLLRWHPAQPPQGSFGCVHTGQPADQDSRANTPPGSSRATVERLRSAIS
jgi:hypothetical protein